MSPGSPVGSFSPGALFELSKRLHSSVAYKQGFGNGDLSDFSGLYGRPAIFDDSPFGTVHGNCPARGHAFRPVVVVIVMFGCSPSDDPIRMDHRVWNLSENLPQTIVYKQESR